MLRYIFDTDHLSLLQRGHPLVKARFVATPDHEIAVTIISIDEQLQGRLAVIRAAKTQNDASRGYQRLFETFAFFRNFSIVLYDSSAAVRFDTLRQQGIRIGTQDLRIATIALEHQATLLTVNSRDFQKVPGLVLDDWTLPLL